MNSNKSISLITILIVSLFYKYTECFISLNMVAYLGQMIEFRCVTNETSKFTRIRHKLPNGSLETLLSNEHLNNDYRRSEIHVEKIDHVYVIKISPVRLHSAGIYICEDDISQQNMLAHNAIINIHVSAPPKHSFIKFSQSRDPKAPFQHGLSSGSSIRPVLFFLALSLFSMVF